MSSGGLLETGVDNDMKDLGRLWRSGESVIEAVFLGQDRMTMKVKKTG